VSRRLGSSSHARRIQPRGSAAPFDAQLSTLSSQPERFT
jgi:hypothetical protein